MTPRSLFNIILKVLGIFFLKNILIELSSFLPFTILTAKDAFNDVEIVNLVVVILEVAVYSLLTYALLFKTNWVINKLKLDEGFQQEGFNLNIHRSTVLRIVIMVTGGLIIIEATPLLIEQIIVYIRLKNEGTPYIKVDYMVLDAVKVLAGIFLIAYQRTLVNFIERKQRIRSSL